MLSPYALLVWTALIFPFAAAQRVNVSLVPAATGFEPDNAAFYYSPSPLLLANDGSAADGGFKVFAATNSSLFSEISHQKTGRSKIAVPVYDVGGRDVIFTIPAPDSIIRIFDAEKVEEIENARKRQLGDWSAACVWRSQQSSNSYIYLFGKKQVVQFLVRGDGEDVGVLEIQAFPIPIEGETCAVFPNGKVFFSAEDRPLYSFQASESTSAPGINAISEDVEIAGLGAYHSATRDFLLVAHDEVVDVYDGNFTMQGTIELGGITDLSIEGSISVLQSQTSSYPFGAFAFAFEGEEDTGIAIGSLDGALSGLGIKADIEYDPRSSPCDYCASPISPKCSSNGFATNGTSCQCFVGFSGENCSDITCQNDCSGHGTCGGPNTCECESGWEGPDCSLVAVQAKYETDANGGDGDDPAVWIHPTDPEQSKVITTTKSEEGAGFAAFDLQGKLLQHFPADQPNNVDVIRNITVGSRQIDLAFAACRGDNTLCFAEINSTGLLESIPGGVQPTSDDYEVYGSCAYHSPTTGKHYIFVNNKDALYLQYELTASPNGTLATTLVRNFTGGSGGQVEGCVADEQAGFLFLGEEPEGIWRYDAEPTGPSTGLQIAKVGDGKLSADVEGLTLVPAKNGTGGYLFVSSQGISSYLVYERAPPHEYVMTFTIVDNEDGGVDHVSNTDGIAAVGGRLNDDFPGGLFVTHDDANELAEGGTASEASFKMVSLVDILGEDRVAALGY